LSIALWQPRVAFWEFFGFYHTAFFVVTESRRTNTSHQPFSHSEYYYFYRLDGCCSESIFGGGLFDGCSISRINIPTIHRSNIDANTRAFVDHGNADNDKYDVTDSLSNDDDDDDEP